MTPHEREVMKQGLDALEMICGFKNSKLDIPDVMKAIRTCLAQPEGFNPDWDQMAVLVEEQQRMAKRIEELTQLVTSQGIRLMNAESQPEPEPVTTLFGSLPVYNVPPSEPVAYLTKRKVSGTEGLLRADMVDRSAKNKETHDFVPLYTAPPQRKWVGLTDEEIAKAIGAEPDDIYLADFRKVEAKLKEKNT